MISADETTEGLKAFREVWLIGDKVVKTEGFTAKSLR
jgi:hypothetical protein